MNYRVIVVDDEDTIRNLLKSRLERDGYDVSVASNAADAKQAFDRGDEVGVLITDLKMPGEDGFALMKWAKEQYPGLRTIMITGHGDKEVAIQALKAGAADYLEKPFDMDELSHTVGRCLREYRLEQENEDLLERLQVRVTRAEKSDSSLGEDNWYVSKSPAMTKVNEWMGILRRESMRGGGDEPTVLIQGESGTGKEGIARQIHAGSRRARGPWVAVNCANFNEQLLESELFGHEKGAFTGASTLKRGLIEIAKGGTLFLDEIGEIEPKLQAKLLRVLQEKTYRRVGATADMQADIRIVAATNRELERLAQEGKFRDDLFHRLCRVVIDLPTLRSRREDLLPMAEKFAQRAFSLRQKSFQGFTDDAQSVIELYEWPGNVRELLNVLERVALVWQGEGKVSAAHLSLPRMASPVPNNVTSLHSIEGGKSEASSSGFELGLDGFMAHKKRWTENFEREYIRASLARHQGNVSAAAREAKMDRSNYLRMMRRHGLRADSYRSDLKTAA